jgi:hypothetical protein
MPHTRKDCMTSSPKSSKPAGSPRPPLKQLSLKERIELHNRAAKASIEEYKRQPPFEYPPISLKERQRRIKEIQEYEESLREE